VKGTIGRRLLHPIRDVNFGSIGLIANPADDAGSVMVATIWLVDVPIATTGPPVTWRRDPSGVSAN